MKGEDLSISSVFYQIKYLFKRREASNKYLENEIKEIITLIIASIKIKLLVIKLEKAFQDKLKIRKHC